MSNYRRSHEGRVFFFTVVTYQRQKILTTKEARLCLRLAFQQTKKVRPFEIIAIVLLPDHLHSVWKLPENDTDYSIRWRQIKTQFTRNWQPSENVHIATTESREKRGERNVWQRRFFEHTCRDEIDLKRCIDYVHVNPVKHGLVEQVKDWPWSSFHRYVRLGEYEANWGSSQNWFGDEFANFE